MTRIRNGQRRRNNHFAWGLLSLIAFVNSTASAQEPTPSAGPWVVILVGYPGSGEYSERFGTAVQRLRERLPGLGFAPERILVGPLAPTTAAAPTAVIQPPSAPTAAEIRQLLEPLKERASERDSLWVIILGHGNYDGRQAFWHLAGRDPSATELAGWLDGLKPRRQVIWLTQSAAGWFVKPLSRDGRIVIAATAADDEFNATQFPIAFAEVLSSASHAKLDHDRDGRISVAEILQATHDTVQRRFTDRRLAATEHAQLDDNGDGIGTPADELFAPAATTTTATPAASTTKMADGFLARATYLPRAPTAAPDPLPPAEQTERTERAEPAKPTLSPEPPPRQ